MVAYPRDSLPFSTRETSENKNAYPVCQQDIADATGIKRANIARLELKKNEASLDSLVRYAKSMELDLSIELVGMKEVS